MLLRELCCACIPAAAAWQQFVSGPRLCGVGALSLAADADLALAFHITTAVSEAVLLRNLVQDGSLTGCQAHGKQHLQGHDA